MVCFIETYKQAYIRLKLKLKFLIIFCESLVTIMSFFLPVFLSQIVQSSTFNDLFSSFRMESSLVPTQEQQRAQLLLIKIAPRSISQLQIFSKSSGPANNSHFILFDITGAMFCVKCEHILSKFISMLQTFYPDKQWNIML